MGDTKKGPKETSSVFGKLLELFVGLRSLLSNIKNNIVGQAESFIRRTVYFILAAVTAFIGMLFMILGLFFLIIDYAQVSRGVVFSVGGLVVFLVAVIFMQAAKIRKLKR